MNNKKRFKKDHPVDENINYDSEDVSNSEDEYSEAERRILEKVRKKRTVENFDSEDEVFGLQDENEEEDDEEFAEDDEKDSMASDIENLQQDDDDLPDERAWGKKKRAYYSTDYVDQDYASASHKDMADAEMEEKEARSIQKRLAEQLDDADFGLDMIQAAADGDESEEDGEHIVKTDLSQLSKREKQALMRKESPEFEALVTDFKERMTEAKNILSPFLKLVEQGRCPDCLAVAFIKTKYQLILNYCVNINFYLMLKSKRVPVNSHPVIKRLAQYRQLLGQLEEGQGKLLVQAEEILEADKEGRTLYSTLDNTEINQATSVKKTKSKKKKIVNERKISESEPMEDEEEEEEQLKEEMEEATHSENDASDEDLPAEGEGEIEVNAEDEKRGITYQIAKNKGLTPHRKKEQRNPRVKHRNKYRKAKIRRKGAVREVRKEINRYDGEISGIKASVKKSIKIK